MQEMTIQYKTNGGHGTMRLNLREFFPCTKAVLKKILKVVDMTDEPELHKADLILYLNERMDEAANEKDRRVLKFKALLAVMGQVEEAEDGSTN